jgi:ABC-type antimicrobial peptide transport system permease subunit
MNTAFRKANIDSDVRAVSWEAAFGYLAELILFFRIVLSMLVNFIFFVAVVVIINTLSMTAMERTYEIGMMRAIGAEKGFVGKMFFTETSLLSFLFGGLGMGAGMAIVLILAAAEIPATGSMMRLVFGGDTFKPMIDVNSIILGIIQLMIVTLISMIYPIILARSITPLEAITGD